MWERMVEKTGQHGDQMTFLSTHPSHGERINGIHKQILLLYYIIINK